MTPEQRWEAGVDAFTTALAAKLNREQAGLLDPLELVVNARLMQMHLDVLVSMLAQRHGLDHAAFSEALITRVEEESKALRQPTIALPVGRN